jgi:hypothetical protein
MGGETAGPIHGVPEGLKFFPARGIGGMAKTIH